MSETSESRWRSIPWPYELELLTLVLVSLAVLAPMVMTWAFPPDLTGISPTAYRPLNELEVRQSFLGGSFVMLLYIAHLFWAFSTTEFISVSASHLLAPTMFGSAAYIRMAQHNFHEGLTGAFFNGSAFELALVVALIQLTTWGMARNRMRVYMKRFKGERWEVVQASRVNRSYLRLVLSRIEPLFYPPRRFRAGQDGILVEGYSYLMPIPFCEVERVFPVVQSQLSSPGTYLALAADDLIGLKLFEEMDPIFISPEHPAEFFNYCEDRLEILSY